MKQPSTILAIIMIFISAGIMSFAGNDSPKEDIFLTTKVMVDETKNEKYDWYDYYLQKISYLVDGKTQWTVALPERMTNQLAYKLYKEAPDLNRVYRPYYLHGLLYTDDVLGIADNTGVLLMNKQNGITLANVATGKPADRNSFFVDSRLYTIKIKEKTYKGRTYTRSSFMADCESHIVFFNGLTLMVFDTTAYKLRETIMFDNSHLLPGNRELPDGIHKSRGVAKFMRIKAATCEVELTGIVYL